MLTKVLIIQPLVPKYRIPFFNRLLTSALFEINIISGRDSPFFPQSCASAEDFADLNHPTRTLLNGLFYWQKKVWIPQEFGRGDIIVLTGSPRLLNNYLLFFQARLKKMKVVWWGHGGNASTEQEKIFIRRILMRFADVLILYMETEANFYIDLGFSSDRVFGLNNTIDTDAILKYKREWSIEQVNSFKLNHGFLRTVQLLFVGRLVKKCKLGIALEALQHLPNSYELIVIGDGLEMDEFQLQARNVGVSHRVHWIGAVYEEEYLAPFFMAASCMIYPGNIGLSLMHSFAYGLPVITHDDSRTHGPEFSALVNGLNGMTFQRDNVLDLATKILDLCGDRDRLTSMGHKAFEMMQMEFSIHHMVSTFIKALKKCTAI